MDENVKLEAEIKKLEAETREIDARTARAAEVARQTDARTALRLRALELEVEAKDFQTRSLQHYEDVNTITLAKQKRDEQVLLSDWRFDHTLNFVGHVAKDTVQATIDKLHMWSRIDPKCDMTIIFDSPGGSVIDGMALYDYIRFLQGLGHHITTIALGYAASMGGILLQVGDVRCMAKGSWLLIHEVSFGSQGKIGEVEDMYEFGKRLKEQAATIFIERSKGKLTREVLEKMWNRKDCWLSPDEALALGLIDEVR